MKTCQTCRKRRSPSRAAAQTPKKSAQEEEGRLQFRQRRGALKAEGLVSKVFGGLSSGELDSPENVAAR